MRSSRPPRLTVVIPTYNRAALLDRCLQSLAGQASVPGVEVVVIDDGSQDETPNLLARWAVSLPSLVTLTQSANAGPAAARNRGVDAARAELVLFMDDDVTASDSLISGHLAAHEAGDEDLAVLGRVRWHPSLTVTPFMRWLDRSGLQFAYETWLRSGPVDPPYAAFYTANLSVRTERIIAAGRFDETFPFAAYEDMELGFRMTQQGLHMTYDADLIAYHTRTMTAAGYAERMYQVGRSAALLAQVRPELVPDDTELRRQAVGRAERLRRRGRAAWRRDDAARAADYWATIGSAYLRGLEVGRPVTPDG